MPRSQDAKVVLLLAGCGIVGTLVAVSLAVSIPKMVLKAYIGAMVLAIGVLILLQMHRHRRRARSGTGTGKTFSWRRLALIGLISSFNKGLSGGGYGPLLTGGQILAGREGKSAVGSTIFAEGFVCLVGFLAYLATQGPGKIDWGLTVPLVIGAVISAPLAALTTRKIPTEGLKLIIAIVTIVLGSWTLTGVLLSNH
ncbi:TPA: sulfite exporter TauE/SafE family protein [Candidatus Bipolaricaulota bacterium]|nr:sulfite exporter TauE/SafE family protein [Candidatus Bipolaricaulota bacterium]